MRKEVKKVSKLREYSKLVSIKIVTLKDFKEVNVNDEPWIEFKTDDGDFKIPKGKDYCPGSSFVNIDKLEKGAKIIGHKLINEFRTCILPQA